MTPAADASGPWPPLPLDAWSGTCDTLHMWTQVVGKIQLALAPPINHWWHVALHATSRGLTTGPMPYGGEALEMAFDFVDHRLRLSTSDARTAQVDLAPRPVADFYAEVMDRLAGLGRPVRVWPMPVEVPDPIRFDRDRTHAAYDREWAGRWWLATLASYEVLEEFRGRFVGKCSPVHFFWGSFDLAVTRFNGRRAPAREGADAVTREAYSHEVISAGFWPGRAGVSDAAFYAYAAPAPSGFADAGVRPAAARYDRTLGEFILPYEAVRASAAPREALLEFLQTTYAAAADLGGWDRAALER